VKIGPHESIENAPSVKSPICEHEANAYHQTPGGRRCFKIGLVFCPLLNNQNMKPLQ